MIDTPSITQTVGQLTAIIRLTVPRAEIRNVMGPGLRKCSVRLGSRTLAPRRTTMVGWVVSVCSLARRP